ncbi:mRNA splicing protein prp18 [Thoreauomyces humboldtii]|nr:mRNA splicing protein prp18 [Thoreauomyces humboldtii]
MDILKAELAKQKAALAEAKAKGAGTSATGPKKYLKRGELEKQREEQYRIEQEKLEQSRRERQARRDAEVAIARGGATAGTNSGTTSSPNRNASTAESRKADSAAGKNQDGGETAGPHDDDDNADGSNEAVDYDIAESELVRRFRAREQPIRLFGETNKQRMRRLRLVEGSEERTEGQRNDFRAAMAATDQDIVNDNLKRKASMTEGADGDEEEVDQYSRKKSSRETERELVDTTVLTADLLAADPDRVHTLLSVYFKRVLREWERSLDARPEDVKRSVQGRLAAATAGQTAEYMRPFFKQLKKRQLQPDVLARVTEIAKLMQDREYLQANDSYLRLSIGNAPWPIGVTMVGIHERSAREKIFSSQVAHVLNDEAQRKWIQSIKRLMTFAQTKWPPDDHAKRVG